MNGTGVSIVDWLQLAQNSSQTNIDSQQMQIAVVMLVIAVAQAVLFGIQLLKMGKQQEKMDAQTEFLSTQLRLQCHPLLKATNFQVWPADGKEGDNVTLEAGKTISIRAHTVNVGGSTAYLCEKEKNCLMAYVAKSNRSLPMFRPYKSKQIHSGRGSDLASLRVPHNVFGYSSEQIATELAPGEFGFWQFDYVIADDFSEGDVLYLMGFVACWDAPVSGPIPRMRRRLVAFAKEFCEKDQVFSSVNSEINPDYEYEE